jgi:hypothetical protein
MTRLLTFGVAVAVSAVGARCVEACSCLSPELDPVAALEPARLAVTATVIGIKRTVFKGQSKSLENGREVIEDIAVPMALVRLQVIREWKGEGKPNYDVLAQLVEGDTKSALAGCVTRLRLGQAYLIYAVDPSLSVTDCLPTRHTSKAKADIRALARHAAAGRP